MSEDPSSQDFVLTIVDVFTLTGRGTVVIGPMESGVTPHPADLVEIWDGKELVCNARATVGMIRSLKADPRSIALLLGDIDKNLLRTGQTVRRSATATDTT